MNQFMVDRKYTDLLDSVGISAREVLRKSQLPEDLFSHKTPSMTISEYFRFMNAIHELSIDETTPIKIAMVENIETFSPPIFAAYCSKNALTCMKRIARYKKLICPLVFLVEQNRDGVSVEMTMENSKYKLPEFLIETEMAFLVNLIRNAVKEHIVPQDVMVRHKITNHAYKDFLGIEPRIGTKNMLTLSREDAEKPFISQNDAMWDYFEPELKRRLSELEVDDSFAARVRSALLEFLPGGGESGIEDVAIKLGYSKRTLQRKLRDENTTFQKQLNHTRELLAKYYLNNTDMTSDDIAYLLGYQDLNSFLRAFNLWTGMTISKYKKYVGIL